MEDRQDVSFRIEDYDFELPPELIAQVPAPERSDSRLLVLDRLGKSILHSRFNRIGTHLNPGDLLVVNDTKVVPARLFGRKESGGRIEFLVLDPYKSPGPGEGYCCLVKASKSPKAGQVIHLEEGFRAEIVAPLGEGKAWVRFPGDCSLLEILDRIGHVPLPPYIARPRGDTTVNDFACYQTEYACKPGAVAAPTAGLHFSKPVLEDLKERGIESTAVTLHVGYGTFAPLRCEDIREHRIHSEYIEVGSETADVVKKAKKDRRRVIAVGTTVVRTLEWVNDRNGEITAFSGSCDHYIYPGYRFKVVDRMITNFHLPQSSLILLVSAFAGRKNILDAYGEAVRERYRFFSYGDAMLIL
jgi:S-adenosylmethionine:tRNA ribosyltransferase-isomerase